ncbi:tetratricopeptide repeat protein [Sulfuricurvum sp.]|uniref:tetratricopeptide repeat protein n=1 Tax=Sulfuricurvum sp. TaxID=2025608 RepID=UPI00286DFF22|nr:tetratricopeptide repeat protein [Sulfuricurvum sp.]
MSFLHPEFLLWLLAPTLALFYFWLTQKPLRNRWLDEEVLLKLRAPETTMGLKPRNTLFLAAAILLIIAMAQPVIIDSTPIKGKQLHIIVAIDLGEDNFEQTHAHALSTLYTLLGERIELIAFDDHLYRIVPRSNDGGILAELIKHLAPSAKLSNKSILEEKLLQSQADLKIVVTSTALKSENFITVSSSADVVNVHEKLLHLRETNQKQVHIPLFFYPLGVAMLLILFALSSMSKRRSVSVSTLLLLFSLDPTSGNAGLLDFRELSEAKATYARGEYEKSERLYTRYQLQHDSPEVRYNRANALYMSGRYERARYWYERVYTTDPILKERTRHNLQKSIAKIKITQSRKVDEDKGGSKARSPLPNTPIPMKRLPRVTRLFEG